jgi:hypothetical protein
VEIRAAPPVVPPGEQRPARGVPPTRELCVTRVLLPGRISPQDGDRPPSGEPPGSHHSEQKCRRREEQGQFHPAALGEKPVASVDEDHGTAHVRDHQERDEGDHLAEDQQTAAEKLDDDGVGRADMGERHARPRHPRSGPGEPEARLLQRVGDEEGPDAAADDE